MESSICVSNLAPASRVARVRDGIPYFALRLVLLAGPNDMALVPAFAEALKDTVVRGNTEHKVPRGEEPGLGEHDGILDGSFVDQHVAMAGVAVGYVLLIAMNQSVRLHNLVTGLAGAARFGVSLGAAQPGFIIQTGDVGNQGIAFPVA